MAVIGKLMKGRRVDENRDVFIKLRHKPLN